MSENKVTEKIYSYLDGEMSPAEKAEFENYLSDHPDDAAQFREWEKISGQIEKEKGSMLNPDLKQEILKRIDRDRYVKQEPKSLFLTFLNWVGSFWHEESLRFGFTFVGGIFAGFLVLSVLNSDNSVNSADATGTLYNAKLYNGLKMGDVIQFDTPEVKALFTVKYSPAIVEVLLNLSSQNQVNSDIDFDLNNVKVLNIQNSGVNDQSSTTIAGDKITIKNTGTNKYSILLENKNLGTNEIAFKIFRSDSLVYQNSITINKK